MNLLDDMKTLKTRTDLPAFLRAHALNHRMAEIGVRFGHNLRQLLAAGPSMLYGVDHWRESANPAENDTALSQRRLDAIYQDCARQFLCDPSVKLLRMSSAGAAEVFPNEYFDFVFVDADHSKEGAWNDLNRWWHKVRWWGILAIHDYCKFEAVGTGVEFGVQEAVTEFREKFRIGDEWFHVTDDEFATAILVKGKRE